MNSTTTCLSQWWGKKPKQTLGTSFKETFDYRLFKERQGEKREGVCIINKTRGREGKLGQNDIGTPCEGNFPVRRALASPSGERSQPAQPLQHSCPGMCCSCVHAALNKARKGRSPGIQDLCSSEGRELLRAGQWHREIKR